MVGLRACSSLLYSHQTPASVCNSAGMGLIGMLVARVSHYAFLSALPLYAHRFVCFNLISSFFYTMLIVIMTSGPVISPFTW